MGGCKMGSHFALVFYASAFLRRYFGEYGVIVRTVQSFPYQTIRSTNQTKQLVRNKQTRLINYSKGLTRGEPLPESARGSCGVKPGLFSFIEVKFSIVIFLFVEETRTLY